MANRPIYRQNKLQKYNYSINGSNNMFGYKIDSILQLTKALDRDINRITRKTDAIPVTDNNLNTNAKLDIIPNIIFEVRDKLETNHKTTQQTNPQMPSTQHIPNEVRFHSQLKCHSIVHFIPELCFS